MSLKTKILQRIKDPVFYRKKNRDIARSFKKFRDTPLPLDIAKQNWNEVVIVVAHPDDETFCSGLICELVAQDIEVRILCLTKGEGGPTGGLDRSELGNARELEMKAACEKLGATHLEFLEHIDPVAGQYRVYAPEVSVYQLAEQIGDLLGNADLIVSHGSCGEYWHPAHLLVFDAVNKVKRSHSGELDWLTFLARQPGHSIPRLVNWDDEPNFQLDVSTHQNTREEALACHQSQTSLFGRFADGTYKDFIEKTSTESFMKR